MNTKENSINVHEYPENASPLELARYQVAVMEAAERGEPVEMLLGDEWHDNDQPDWCWSDGCRYRIARPKIAEGHNPDKLTEAQVGGGAGGGDAFGAAGEDQPVAGAEQGFVGLEVKSDAIADDFQHADDAGWWLDNTSTLRTRQPIGHYLPKPEPVKKFVPWTFETLPNPPFILRHKKTKFGWVGAHWDDQGIHLVGFTSPGIKTTYLGVLEDFEYMPFGGDDWKPCGTEA